MTTIDKIDPIDVIRTVVGSEGNMPLACERLKDKYNDGHTVLEYDVIELLTTDASMQKALMSQLRALAAIRIFQLVIDMGNSVAGKIDDVKPAELMRAHSALLGVFINLTAPQAKYVFDLEAEAIKAAEEFGISIEEARKEIKATLQKVT